MNNPVIDANIYNNLGKVEFDLGLYSQSIDVLDRAARLIPELEDRLLIINIRSNLAKALYLKGELTESAYQLQQAVEIEQEIKNLDIDQDIELLSEIEAELAKPRLVRWIRRKITAAQK